MHKFLIASLVSGAAVWSATGLPAEPTSSDGDAGAAVEAADDVSANPDRPRDGKDPRDAARRRGRPDGERPQGRRGRQRRGSNEEFGARGPDRGGPPRDMLPPLLRALDADGDHEISADEIENAAAALKTLDANSDGKLTPDELRPQFARRGPRDGEGGPAPGEGRGRRFRGDREGFGPPEGFGAPKEGGPPRGRRGFGRGDGPPPEGADGEPGARRRGKGRREFRDGDGPRRRGPHGDRKDGDRPRPPRGGPDGEAPPDSDQPADAPNETKA